MATTTPIVNAGLKYINNLELVAINTTTFSLAAGEARDSTNTNDIILSEQVTINTAQTGVNGLDQGTLTNDKFYAVFVIGDSTKYQETAGLFSLSTDPILPFGYDMFRRVGWIRIDSSGDIVNFIQYGKGEKRKYYLDISFEVINTGTDTAFTEIDFSTAVPAINTEAICEVAYLGSTDSDLVEFNPFGFSAAPGVIRINNNDTAKIASLTLPVALDAGVPKLLYKVAAATSVTITVGGFFDYL